MSQGLFVWNRSEACCLGFIDGMYMFAFASCYMESCRTDG